MMLSRSKGVLLGRSRSDWHGNECSIIWGDQSGRCRLAKGMRHPSFETMSYYTVSFLDFGKKLDYMLIGGLKDCQDLL